MAPQQEDDDAHHHHQLPTATTPDPPPSPSHPRRSICPSCNRPNPMCLCHVLPSHPIETKTQVLIVHHPHESHHKLSTTPILTRSLLRSTAVIGRRLRAGLSSLFDQSPPPAALYLFPSTASSPAVNVSEIDVEDLTQNGERGLVLIAFDGTWKHAREMVKASEEFLTARFAVRVCLGVDESASGGSIYDSELILRKEPFRGCVSTMEAVARVLKVLEPNGAEVESRLIEILREMVKLQARFLKPMNPRPKLLKKKKKERTLERTYGWKIVHVKST